MNVATTFGAETVGSTDAGQELLLAGMGGKVQAPSETASTNPPGASQPSHLSFRSNWQAQLASLSGTPVAGDPDTEMSAADESSESNSSQTIGTVAAVASTSTPVPVLRLTVTEAEQSGSATRATVAVLTHSGNESSAQQVAVSTQSGIGSLAALPGGTGKTQQITKQVSSTDALLRDAHKGAVHQKQTEQGTASIAAAQGTSLASMGNIPQALPVSVQEASQSGLGIQPASDDLVDLSKSTTTSGMALESVAGNQAPGGTAATINTDASSVDVPQDSESLSGIATRAQQPQMSIGTLNQNQIGDPPVTAPGNPVDQNSSATVASSSPQLAAPSKAAQVERYEGTASAGVGSGRPVEADTSVQTPVVADSNALDGAPSSAHNASSNQTSRTGLRFPNSALQQGLAPTGNQPAGQSPLQVSGDSANQGFTVGDSNSASSSAAAPIEGISGLAASGRLSEQVAAHSSHKTSADEQITRVNHSMQAGGGFAAEDAPSLVRNPAATHDATNSTSGETGGNSTANGAGSTVRETFSALDSSAAPAGTNWIHAGSRSAEAGFQDPVLGWVGVKADMNGGGVHATLTASSSDAAQALGGHMAGLSAYLAQGHAHVQTLVLATSGGTEAGFTASQSTNQGMNQGAGQNGSYQPPSGSGQGMAEISAADLSGASAAGGALDPSPAVSFQGSTHISVMA